MIISISEECCGNNEKGTGYTFDKNKICCGTSYVNPELTHCCINEVGQHKVSSVRERYTCDVLRDLIPWVQFKKREKHPWTTVTFSNPATL